MPDLGESEEHQRDLLPGEYEKLVEEICNEIAGNVVGDSYSQKPRRPSLEDLLGVGPVTVRRQCGYRGKSGHEHVVDISVEFSVAGIRFLVVVECKKYRRSVGIEDLLEFASRLEDISAHKGVVVTTAGFQSGAIKIAESKGIALVIYHMGELVVSVGLGPGGSGRFLIKRAPYDVIMNMQREDFSHILLAHIQEMSDWSKPA